jgi:2-(1,2-epoxy-1,2-dihydrophenyl)acetyl-CoA isomerase
MTVRYDLADSVAVITLDRPEVLNAFNDEMGAAALEAVEKASADEAVRCIVITGAGRAFSSGEDLGALASGYEKGEVPDLGDTLIRRYNPLIRAITGAPKPVVAAINGVAAGAGASVALACDHRIAVDKAKLVLAFVKVGLIPDSGALWFLARMIGTARAWRMASSGDPLGAAEALELGILDEVVDPDSFEDAWRAAAREFAAGPTKAYALTKELLYSASESSLHDQLEAEIGGQTAAGKTADHLEGVKAFLGKRAPNYEGR